MKSFDSVILSGLALIAIVGLITGCTSNSNNAGTSVPTDPQVNAWYRDYYKKMSKPGMTKQQLDNMKQSAPAFLFLQHPQFAAQEFNVRIQTATSDAEKTNEYWLALRWFSALRHSLPRVMPQALAMHKQADPNYNLPIGTGEFMGALGRYVSLTQESTALQSLEIRGVDQRALDWAAEYLAWLQKRKALELHLIPDINPQSPVPSAVAESLLRMGLGDPTYLRPFDELRQAANQQETESNRLASLQRELSNEAADLSANCLKTRAALSREYKLEFLDISVE